MRAKILATGLWCAIGVLALGNMASAQSTLRIGLAEDPDILDPTLARTFVGRIVFAGLCDKLFDLDLIQIVRRSDRPIRAMVDNHYLTFYVLQKVFGAELARYTYLGAGCVGEFWTEVHVAHRPRLRHWDLEKMRGLGIRFGKALQMTNVLRDIPRDLRQGRCYLPRHDLALLGLEPKDLLDPKTGPALRPLLVELLNVALDHYEAGWQYTFAIPKRETRMRLACAWPLLIGLRTLDLLAQAPNWLDPGVVLKVPRIRVYGMMAQSVATVWSTRALTRKARQLRERIRL